MEDKLVVLSKKIRELRLHSNISYLFVLLLKYSDLSDNKINTFIKMEHKKATGFLYRLLISNAYKYGVPTIYIKNCKDNKEKYYKIINNKYFSKEDVQRYKMGMYDSYNNLIKATLELISIKNSRKEKINSILEKIVNKN
jgi:hypothetical protein